jgi:hypothetical protein
VPGFKATIQKAVKSCHKKHAENRHTKIGKPKSRQDAGATKPEKPQGTRQKAAGGKSSRGLAQRYKANASGERSLVAPANCSRHIIRSCSSG